jgi:hypothetical protein
MGTQLSQVGSVRGEIIEYGLFEPESGAVGVNIKVRIDEAYDPETQQWDDWRQYDLETDGCIWVIKKDGTINKVSAENLMRAAGWDGNLESVARTQWQPKPVQVKVQTDDYNDTTRYRIAFVNEYDRVPSARIGNIDPEKAKALQAKYGAPLRALAGNLSRNTAAPASDKPKAPRAPMPTTRRPKPGAEAYPDPNAAPPPADDIPF